MEKLELKHIAGYLPYKLMVYGKDWNHEYKQWEMETGIPMSGMSIDCVDGELRKPILHPLSDFQEKVKGVSFSDMITHGYHHEFWTKEKFNVNYLTVHDYNLLMSRHADIHDLIGKGLAISIHDIKQIT